MILYFDVFIIDDNLCLPSTSTAQRAIIESKLQTSCHAYRKRKKIDIVKYTLASYAILNWEHVVIRYECENESQTDPFFNFCRELFPHASIYSARSDTAVKYVCHLDELKIFGNPWVYFSPNNDHPYIASSVGYLEKLISAAEAAEEISNDTPVSIMYSHFTENINSTDPGKYLWGEYAFIFPKIICQDDFSLTLKMNKYVCDSIQIFRLNDLVNIFKNTHNDGKVIRLEDTEFYLTQNIKNIVIVPKVELCRHYDGYFHRNVWNDIASAPPPLFIPHGFFERTISIRYGYADYVDGYVNINPIAENLIYIDDRGVDLRCVIDDIPLFWYKRINETVINPRLNSNATLLAAQINKYTILNPWNSFYLENIIRSCFRYLTSPFKFLYQCSRIYLFKQYGSLAIYRYFVKIRDKYFGFPY